VAKPPRNIRLSIFESLIFRTGKRKAYDNSLGDIIQKYLDSSNTMDQLLADGGSLDAGALIYRDICTESQMVGKAMWKGE